MVYERLNKITKFSKNRLIYMVVAEKIKKIRFKQGSDAQFYDTVKNRVGEEFAKRGLSYNANAEMYLKSAIMVIAYLSIYFSIISNYFGAVGVIVLYGLLGLAKGLMGFNLTHDALHGSYSSNTTVNRILGYTFDFNGTSSLIWKIAHNVHHHTYTNIPGFDEDIDKAIWLRLSPKDRLYWFHRFQHWYAPVLYCLTGLNWVFVSDYTWFIREAAKRKISKKDIAIFLTFKLINLFLFIIYPLIHLNVAWWVVILGYLCLQFVGGLTIALIFQLAHIVEPVKYFEPNEEGQMRHNWAIHEMYTTSNFATNNKVLSTIVGGLNFQVEHHLFPYICHVHYKIIAPIVKKTAEEFGIPYYEQPTFFAALRSHFRTLKMLGRSTGKISV